MNEKIKELLDKAEVYYNDDMYSDYNDLESLQKFAELIVRECIEVVGKQKAKMSYGPTFVIEDIEKHFGVEE